MLDKNLGNTYIEIKRNCIVKKRINLIINVLKFIYLPSLSLYRLGFLRTITFGSGFFLLRGDGEPPVRSP